MENKIYLAIFVVIIIIALVAIFSMPTGPVEEKSTTQSQSNTPSANETIEKTDNCADPLIWCEEDQSCYDPHLDHCGKTIPFGEKIALEANEKWGSSRVYPKTSESSVEGWLRASLSIPDAAELSNECYIFMRGDSSRELDSGAYFLEHGPQQINGHEVCEIALVNGSADQCGGLTLRMDLLSMKEMYDPSKDNWQDFFTCTPGVASDFCESECQTMLNILMSQKRMPIEITSN